MQVAVIHRINDQEGFFSSVEEATKEGPPEGLGLPVQVRAKAGATLICLWEAPSVDAVREAVESTVGGSADNEYIEAEYVGVGSAA